MTRQVQKNLISSSYKNGVLDQKMVTRIAGLLNRRDLKLYIRGLKNQEKKLTIVVESPVELSKKTQDEISRGFSGKKVISRLSPDLIMGMRLHDGDNIYRLNVHDRLEDLKTYIGE